MKIFLIVLTLLLSFNLQAQKVRVPVEMWIELPESTAHTNITVINITTNTFTTVNITTNVTQVINNTVSAGTPSIVILSANLIDPSLGTRLLRSFAVPTTFTLGSFKTNNYTTFYWRNPNRQPMTWPSGIVWLNGLPPTNQVRGAVLFEHIPSDGGSVWATQ